LKDPHGRAIDDPGDTAAMVASRFAGRHLLLLTDFDGTLANLVPHPDEAALAPHVRSALAALSSAPHVTLGVVSGRREADVAARVGWTATFVAGLHGLEIVGPGVEFRHRALDEVEAVIVRLSAAARRQLAWCPGCFLEDKRYALTCHVRQTPPEHAEQALEEFEALAEPYLESRVLRLLTGTKAMELLPAVDWHKGRAVDWIRARLSGAGDRRVSVVYLGDDRTDEDAFTALEDEDFAIGVGERPHTHMIDARLSGPEAVGRFFGALRQFRTGSAGPRGSAG
jgi:trehalose-phosphatase